MKHILSLSVALLMACVAFAQNITDFYRPGGFDYNGASIKTFSVSDTTAVQFSRGNLQYNPALNKWRFALRQYSTACGDNANASETYDGWIDLFGWGTSGWNSGATAYQPWATSEDYVDYFVGNNSENNLTGAYANADWGIYNKIENGGKFTGMWRTLTKDEWEYLVGSNTKRIGKNGLATIGGVYNGLMLLPDEWNLPSGCSFTAGFDNGYATNQYTYAQWEKMQSAGAIFLPAAGYRDGTWVDLVGTLGDYWSSTYYNEGSAYGNEGSAYGMYFRDDNLDMGGNTRNIGTSVRLVRRVQTPLVQKGWVDMGLPSGTMWYSCNVGASKPQSYGAHFAWGETKPKAEYSWNTYAHGAGVNQITKYYSGDGLTVLESGDDVASTAIGSDARIPTKDDWQELLDNCSGEWTKYQGVNGYMLTSNVNGSRIFLPASGHNDGSSSYLYGIAGFYWASSRIENYSDVAYAMSCSSSGHNLYYNENRYNGLTVRAVRGGVTQEALAEAFDENGASLKKFTVAEGRTVSFSKGNLWYNPAANLWRFAPEQYEYIGDANSNISETYNEYIDLFGWGTSGWNSGANAYQPWATSQESSDYYPGGSATNSLTGEYANADWGVYNAISNGGNAAGMWRTMTNDEWEYLINTRSASTVGVYENARYAKATVNDVAGLIILPDSFTMPTGVTALDKVNEADGSYITNVYTTGDWAKLESAGAIFLPAEGYRDGTEVSLVGTVGYYWSGTYGDEYGAYVVGFYDDNLLVNGLDRSRGLSVRLVKD